MFLYEELYYCEIRYMSLPLTVKAFTLYDAVNDFYNIYVNNKLNTTAQKKAIEHELRHIKNGDFFAEDGNVSDIEHRMQA